MSGRSIIRKYSTQSKPLISATLLLSRNPVVTADIPEFENQYYKYQNSLWRRLMWTFPKWYYYKEGTLSEQRYRELNKAPVFNNPNFEFPGGRPEIRQQRDRRFKQVVKLPKTYQENSENDGNDEERSEIDVLSRKIVPNSRTTNADLEGRLDSLERKLSRTLYLIIEQDNKWVLPNFAEPDNQQLVPLHQLVDSGIEAIGGDKINHFKVANKPCHLHQTVAKKEYFIKSHILSGEFVPQKSVSQHKWLTKEELADHLDKEYYEEIEHLFSEV